MILFSVSRGCINLGSEIRQKTRCISQMCEYGSNIRGLVFKVLAAVLLLLVSAVGISLSIALSCLLLVLSNIVICYHGISFSVDGALMCGSLADKDTSAYSNT